jgi:hypothetical protein
MVKSGAASKFHKEVTWADIEDQWCNACDTPSNMCADRLHDLNREEEDEAENGYKQTNRDRRNDKPHTRKRWTEADDYRC